MIRIYGLKDGKPPIPNCVEDCKQAKRGDCSPVLDFKFPNEWAQIIRNVEPDHWNTELLDGSTFRSFDWLEQGPAIRRIELIALINIELALAMFNGRDDEREQGILAIKEKFYEARRRLSASDSVRVMLLTNVAMLAITGSSELARPDEINDYSTIIAALTWMSHLLSKYDDRIYVEVTEDEATMEDIFATFPAHADPRRSGFFKRSNKEEPREQVVGAEEPKPEPEEAKPEEKKAVIDSVKDWLSGLSDKKNTN